MVSQEIVPKEHEIKFKISNKTQQLGICTDTVTDWLYALEVHNGNIAYLTSYSNSTRSYTFQTGVEYSIILKDDVCTLSLRDTVIFSWTARSSRRTGNWYLRLYAYSGDAGFDYIKIKEL